MAAENVDVAAGHSKRRLNIDFGRFDWIQLNEAFASQALACLRQLGLAYDADHVNTQMYFPGDPLLPLDPIFNSIADENARNLDRVLRGTHARR